MSPTKSTSFKQENSNYQSLYLWASFLLGMISLGVVIWDRRSIIPVNEKIQSLFSLSGFEDLNDYGNGNSAQYLSTYQITPPPDLVSSLAVGAFAYQLSRNPFVSLLSSWSLFFTPILAQPLEWKTVVSEFRVNVNKSDDQQFPALASLKSGDWVVVWKSGVDNINGMGTSDIYARRYTDNGTALGTEFRVNTNTQGDQRYPAVISLISGDWVVVWYSYHTGDSNIYGQRYALNGTAIYGEFLINTVNAGTQANPAIVSLTSGDWIVAWWGDQKGRDIYARRFALNGTAINGEFQVNTIMNGWQSNPALVSLNSVDWVVAWWGDQKGSRDIYVQRFALNGSSLGSEYQVNTGSSGNQEYIALLSLISYEWIVSWSGSQSGKFDIYAQRYVLNGTALNNEFQVNTNATGDQYGSSLAKLTSIGWIAVWDGNSDVYAQCYDLNGDKLGNEFLVNTEVLNSQVGSIVVSLNSGNIVVAWGGNQAGDPDIYAAIFSFEPLALTTTFSTPSSTSALTSSLPSTMMNVLTNSSTSSTLQSSATTNNNSVTTTQVITPSSQSTSFSAVTKTTSSNNENQSTSTTPQEITMISDNSGITGGVIGAVVGSVCGIISLAICAAAVGLYRKKSRTNQTNNTVSKEQGRMFKNIENYQQIPIVSQNPQTPNEYAVLRPMNNESIGTSTYAIIDEIKKPENQYDNAPKLEI